MGLKPSGFLTIDPRMPESVKMKLLVNMLIDDVCRAGEPSVRTVAMSNAAIGAYLHEFHDASVQRIAIGSASLLGLTE